MKQPILEILTGILEICIAKARIVIAGRDLKSTTTTSRSKEQAGQAAVLDINRLDLAFRSWIDFGNSIEQLPGQFLKTIGVEHIKERYFDRRE